MIRRVLYTTGTRADFGLMLPVLTALDASEGFELGLCVTGSHLHESRGRTIDEIFGADLNVVKKIPTAESQPDGLVMATDFGIQTKGVAEAISDFNPDIVLVLGDRAEMLATAAAAVMQNHVVAHIHGGERSGTVDELFRHAISKLSHFHFAATEAAARRLIKMGEYPENVVVSGAPGLDALENSIWKTKQELARELGFVATEPLAVVSYHPVVQSADNMASEVAAVVDAVSDEFNQAIVIAPNSDPGGQHIETYLEKQLPAGFGRVTHVARSDFLSLLQVADVLVGNSSAGIIEAASFGLRVVNVGTRQNLREHGDNVTDVPAVRDSVRAAIADALRLGAFEGVNIYGDGRATERIISGLAGLPLDNSILNKANAY